jgi:excisionase family DNA binding protein
MYQDPGAHTEASGQSVISRPRTPTQVRPEPPEEEPYTPKEAARLLRVNAATIRRWVADGRLRGVRAGPRLIRIPRAGVRNILGH